jgi:hypothetical protein
MIYGKMMTREHLINLANPAVVPLFDVMALEKENGERWLSQMKAELPILQATPLFESMSWMGMYSVAQCIGLLGDNLARVYCESKKQSEWLRKDCGVEVRPGFTFGKLFWLIGNTARHYGYGEPWEHTQEALNELWVEKWDESTALYLLSEVGRITDTERFIEVIIGVLDDIDARVLEVRKNQ